MDFRLTEEQTLIVATVREVTKQHFDATKVREMEASAEGFSRVMWERLAELGLTSLLSDANDGAGGHVVLAALVAEELGAALCRTPFIPTCVVAAPLLAAARHPALDDIERAHAIVAVVPAAAGVAARRESGGAWELSGSIDVVPYAHVATALIVVAADSVFWVPSGTAGVRARRVGMLDGGPVAHLELARARVPSSAVLGSAALVERRLRDGVAVEAAELAGGASAALALTVAYLKERVQFDRPIGSFQVLQQRAAELATRVDAARLVPYEAAWRADRDEPDPAIACAARALAAAAYLACGAQAVQMAGGYGFMEEYDMQLHFRRSKAAALQAGVSADLAAVCTALAAREATWCR